MSRKVVLAALLAVIVLAAPIAALQEDLTATRNLLGDKPNKVKNTAGAGGGAASGGQAVAGGSGTSISGSTNTGGDGIYISDGRRLLNEKPKKVKVTNTAGAGGGAASGGQALAGGEENVVSGSDNTGGDGIYDGRRLLNEKPKKVKVTNTAGAGGGAASGGQALAGGEYNDVSGSYNTGGDGIYDGRRLLNEKPKKVKVTNTAGAGGGAASGGQALAGGEENVVSGSDNTGGDGIYGRRLL